MAFITDAQLKAAVTSIKGLANGSSALPSKWTEPITAANSAATNWLKARLRNMGYTVAQILLWDSAYDYSRRLALCFLFREVTLDEGQAVNTDSFCSASKELLDKENFVFTIAGEVVDAATGGDSNRITAGVFNQRSSTDETVGLDTEF